MRGERGLSVVETIVVVVCIVVCLLVAVPLHGQKRMQAEDLGCMVNLHQWGEIFQYYTERSGGRFITSHPWYWIQELNETHKDRDKMKIWLCPRADQPMLNEKREHIRDSATFSAWGIFMGEDYGPTGMAGSYGLNGYALDAIPDMTFEGDIDTNNNWRRLDVKGAASIPLFLDALRFDTWPRDTESPPEKKEHDWGSNHMARCCIDRHNASVNCLFMNQSVRKVGLKELWTLKWHRQFNTAGPWTKAGGVQPEDWPQWMREYKDY